MHEDEERDEVEEGRGGYTGGENYLKWEISMFIS